ncbi:hypothetical protein [Actinoplanes rectilineatus]|uniref:hypothetical protein n=1 Tax=Actinoplanes rectilineatus TaxID=113571 RepID=UPI0012F7A839|nr:hypothetical protein [Actinoplanes rectilineatus]
MKTKTQETDRFWAEHIEDYVRKHQSGELRNLEQYAVSQEGVNARTMSNIVSGRFRPEIFNSLGAREQHYILDRLVLPSVAIEMRGVLAVKPRPQPTSLAAVAAPMSGTDAFWRHHILAFIGQRQSGQVSGLKEYASTKAGVAYSTMQNVISGTTRKGVFNDLGADDQHYILEHLVTAETARGMRSRLAIKPRPEAPAGRSPSYPSGPSVAGPSGSQIAPGGVGGAWAGYVPQEQARAESGAGSGPSAMPGTSYGSQSQAAMLRSAAGPIPPADPGHGSSGYGQHGYGQHGYGQHGGQQSHGRGN